MPSLLATFAALLLALSTFVGFAELKLSVEDAEASGNTGWTEVADGNPKGQTLELDDEASFSGIALAVGNVTTAKDLRLSIYKTNKKGFPAGDPLVTDSGSLPKGLSGAHALRVELASPQTLQAGTYAIVLETASSKLRFRLENGTFADGRLVRKKQGAWTFGAGIDSDLAFTLLGDNLPARTAAAVATKPVVKGPAPAPATFELNRAVSTNVTPLCKTLPARPNIVTVMVDDLGWNQISVPQSTMGTAQPEFATPMLERLASKGLSFTHAYSQPNCAPTRAAMLSGQYPARIHNDVYVVNNLNRNGGAGISKAKAKFFGPEQSEDVAPAAITVAEALKENGYATAHIGKYHVGGRDEATLPENVGFDINIGGYSQGHQSTCFAAKKGVGWAFKGLGRGHFDRFGAPYTAAYVAAHGFPESLIGSAKHVSDAVGDAMEESIASMHAGGKPFYLQLHPYAVHGPVKSRPDLKAAAGGDNLAGFVASIDLIIGRLLKAIDDPNGDGDRADSVAANTLILFTSDNGGTHGHNLPLRGKKGMFTEGGVRVPLIAYWPGVIPPNTVTDRMVHSVDYYPTYLELAGKKWLPPESEHPLDGESFAEILRQPNSELDRGPIFYLFPGYMDVRAQPCVVSIDEVAGVRYKLLYFYEADAWELYDISNDIGEASNLIKKKPELAGAMAAKIDAWLAQQHPTWQPKYPLLKTSQKPAGPPVF